MNERLIEQVVAEVRRRQEERRPAALLVGRAPERDLGFHYVTQGEYAAVVIGSLSGCALLHLPDETLTQALLLGKPVYLCPEGLEYRQFSRTANRALWSRLLAAERQLKQLGVRFLERGAARGGEKLLTANEVRRLLRDSLCRGRAFSKTIGMREQVDRGEQRYIMPFKKHAHYSVDSFYSAEMGVYHGCLKDALDRLDKEYPALADVVQVLRELPEVPQELVPADSLLREFIGGSILDY